MNSDRALGKVINQETGGRHSIASVSPLEAQRWADESRSALYPEIAPLPFKKHSPQFIHQRLKVRHLAEKRLVDLSEQLIKLANEIRYHDPLIAEALDEAWDATEVAINLMQED